MKAFDRVVFPTWNDYVKGPQVWTPLQQPKRLVSFQSFPHKRDVGRIKAPSIADIFEEEPKSVRTGEVEVVVTIENVECFKADLFADQQQRKASSVWTIVALWW